MKLTEPMRRALSAFERPWVAAWWGGKPMTRYPKGVGLASFNALKSRGLITCSHVGRMDRIVTITPAGRAALEQSGEK